jgi:23S rRNA pseudouridine1911/1915/1917 synthase
MTGSATVSRPNGEVLRKVMVPPGARAERLDRFLAGALGELSRSRIKALILAGEASVDGAAARDPATRVRPGQTVRLRVPAAAEPAPRPQAIPLAVVYEDEHLIVVDKPAGLVVHPAPGNPDRTLVNALLAHCGESLSGIGGVRRPGIVHRLDKDTSGLIVAAKSDAAHHGLAAQFAARSVERAYRAVVWGVPVPSEGTVSGNIGRSPANRKKMAVLLRGGKPAHTRYRLEKVLGGGLASLLCCRLDTGRTHQIRVHLAHFGHPLVGDPAYGRAAARLRRAAPACARTFPRQALHAYLLGFTHPLSSRTLRFESDLPNDIKELLDSFGDRGEAP